MGSWEKETEGGGVPQEVLQWKRTQSCAAHRASRDICVGTQNILLINSANASGFCSLSGSGAAGFLLANVAMGLAQGQLPALNSPGSLC